jgi:hypothetical protein
VSRIEQPKLPADWDQVAAKLGDQWEAFLGDSDDLTTIVVKGHLLVEQRVTAVLDKLLPNPEAVRGFRLIQQVKVLRAIFGKDFGTDVCDAVERLNTLRNTLAHNVVAKAPGAD